MTNTTRTHTPQLRIEATIRAAVPTVTFAAAERNGTHVVRCTANGKTAWLESHAATEVARVIAALR